MSSNPLMPQTRRTWIPSVLALMAAVTLGASADSALASGISVNTTVNGNCGEAGGLQFSVEICNTTTQPLTDVVVTNTLAIGLEYVAGSLASPDMPVSLCEPVAGQTIKVCLGEPLLAGQCITVTFQAKFFCALVNHVTVKGYGPPPPNQGDEGCTPGFWKNHAGKWGPTGYNPCDDFDATFGVNMFTPNRTLFQALNQGGGGINSLGRHAVAALLNAAHPDVDYALTTAQVIQAVQNAVAQGGSAIEQTKNLLEGYNEKGCPVGCKNNDNGEPEPEIVTGSQTIKLDAMLNDLIADVCNPPPCDSCCPPSGECTVSQILATFCVLPPEDVCNPDAVITCLTSFYDYMFMETDAAVNEFLAARCTQCCPEDPTCSCLVGE